MAGIKNVKSLQTTLESSSTCYCSQRLWKRVPNGRSRDTERSPPELSSVTSKEGKTDATQEFHNVKKCIVVVVVVVAAAVV